jgi:hypothetical protein
MKFIPFQGLSIHENYTIVTEVLLYDWHSEGAERHKLEFGMDSRRNNNLRHRMRKSTYVHMTTCISNAVDMVVVSGTGKRIHDSLTLAPSPLKKNENDPLTPVLCFPFC